MVNLMFCPDKRGAHHFWNILYPIHSHVRPMPEIMKCLINVSCSQDFTTNFETKNPKFPKSSSIHLSSILCNQELEFGTGNLWKNILFTFCVSAKIKSKLNYRLVTYKLASPQVTTNYKYLIRSVLIELAPSKEERVNKYLKFENNFDIQFQLKHFEYDMKPTINTNLFKKKKWATWRTSSPQSSPSAIFFIDLNKHIFWWYSR